MREGEERSGINIPNNRAQLVTYTHQTMIQRVIYSNTRSFTLLHLLLCYAPQDTTALQDDSLATSANEKVPRMR